jgi:putative alpha-1,2-mannosidase
VHRLLNEETNNCHGTNTKWKQLFTRKTFMDSPKGYIKEMDDDAGTISDWYVCCTLGLHSVFPGSTQMIISIPPFNKIIIKLPWGKLKIETSKSSDKAILIQNPETSFEELNCCFIDLNRLKKG